jgi:hypothetical protein
VQPRSDVFLSTCHCFREIAGDLENTASMIRSGINGHEKTHVQGAILSERHFVPIWVCCMSLDEFVRVSVFIHA